MRSFLMGSSDCQCFHEDLGKSSGGTEPSGWGQNMGHLHSVAVADPGCLPGSQQGQYAWVAKKPQLCVAPERGKTS